MRLTICLYALLLSGTAGFAAEVKPAWQVEWEKTIAAAEKEGQVTPYIFDQGPVTVEVIQAFERAFPKIKVNQVRGRGSDLGPRIVAERRAGKYLADVFTGGKGTAHATLYIGKALAPLKPLLLLPEVDRKSTRLNSSHVSE